MSPSSCKMKAAVLMDVGNLEIKEVDVPRVGPGEVLVKVMACGICGSDVSMYRGRYLPVKPIIPGHEFAGEVVEVGDGVKYVKPGERVVADINVSCGICYYCKRMQKLFCPNMYQIGIHSNGAFAEYIKVPEQNIISIPTNVSYEHAAFMEPLSCVISVVDKANIATGDIVVVIGDGPLGISASRLAKLSGASTVIVCGHHDYRLNKAKEMGADVIVNTKKVDPLEVVLSETDRRGADVVLEVVGKPTTYRWAIDMVRRGGRIALMGVPGPADKLELMMFNDIFNKELSLNVSFAGTYDKGIRALALIGSKKFDVSKLITHRIGLENLLDGLMMMEKKADNVIKIVTLPETKGIERLQ